MRRAAIAALVLSFAACGSAPETVTMSGYESASDTRAAQLAAEVAARRQLADSLTAEQVFTQAQLDKVAADARRAEAVRLARQASRSAAAARPRHPAPQVSGDLLDRLANCESGGNPQAVGGGGRFYGAFQFMLSTWRNLVARLGLPYSGDPRNHSYAQQKDVVARGIPVSSWRNQFPHCARKLGVA